MPHPSSNHLISRVRDFIRWQEKMFGDPSARGAPLENPPGWVTDKEFWIRNTVWRETIFEGNPGDSSAAADALIDHGLLRAKRRERDLEVLERTTTVRMREQTFRAFAVSKSILSWKENSRTFAILLDVLNRHRGKGLQKITVEHEHVHTHTGGQAIVGSESQSGGGRDSDENRGQPRAPENAAQASQLALFATLHDGAVRRISRHRGRDRIAGQVQFHGDAARGCSGDLCRHFSSAGFNRICAENARGRGR
jgi:hypothetical protein